MDRLQPLVIRPAKLARTVGSLLQISFPVSGVLSTTQSLGIVWKDASDHTKLLGPIDGFDWPNGFGYLSVNLWSFQVSTNASDASYKLAIFSVDKNGADIAQISSFSPDAQAGGSSFDTISIGVSGGATAGAGLRGQFTAASSGTVTMNIPVVFTFYGRSSGPT